jgi:hypothetical protein
LAQDISGLDFARLFGALVPARSKRKTAVHAGFQRIMLSGVLDLQ